MRNRVSAGTLVYVGNLVQGDVVSLWIANRQRRYRRHGFAIRRIQDHRDWKDLIALIKLANIMTAIGRSNYVEDLNRIQPPAGHIRRPEVNRNLRHARRGLDRQVTR